MSYQIIKPEINSVPSATWSILKKSWLFWGLFLGCIAGAFIFSALEQAVLLQILIFGLIGQVSYVLNKVRTSFWKEVAVANGWNYAEASDVNQESGIMFRQGHSNFIKNKITGSIDGRQFRIYNYQFMIGSGKSSTTYQYIVFTFKFKGSFPHMYLNNSDNSYNINIGEKIPLPSELEKKFTLSSPKEYEIETLEIFTEDILAKLLDSGLNHDVELVGQEVLMFTEGNVNSFKELEKEFNKALTLEDLLDEKLDKFKFEKIGDMSHTL
ncbi:MAG: hypothetical protein WAZ40_02115 [Minisyncoccia bacterium]